MSSSPLALEGSASQEEILKMVMQAYTDTLVSTSIFYPHLFPTLSHISPLSIISPFLLPQVWDQAEKLYSKFCQKRAAGGLPPLAVLLSIL